MTLKKGSRWGSLTSPNPINWRTIVRLDVVKIERMDYDLVARYNFNSLGQFLSSKTKLYFLKEAEAFNEAMLNFKVDIDGIEQIGNEASSENTKNMFFSSFNGSSYCYSINICLQNISPSQLIHNC